MYVEIYIDQFFAEQLLTGWILLYLAAFAGKLRTGAARFLASGLFGAVMQCLYVIWGRRWLSAAGYAGMAFLAFGSGERAKGLLFLAVSSVCFGGILEAVMALIPVNAAAGVIVSCLILQKFCKWYRKNRRKAEEEVDLLLIWDETELSVRALVDTGNRLTEPVTGRPVSILDCEAAVRLLGSGWEERKGFLLVPYHSIGREQGWMRAVAIDRMIIETSEGRLTFERPLLAISNEKINLRNQYQVILNPEHLHDARGKNMGTENFA